MKKYGTIAVIIGLLLNFAMFLTKLYVGISSNSLSVYCDAINNLGDTMACAIAIFGFVMLLRMDERRSARAQSLCTFVISAIIAVTGGYFIYNGIERLMYPLPVSYTRKYAVLIIITVFVKILMGIMYYLFNKRAKSTVLKAMILDSFLDCIVTITALMSLFLINRIQFAADGLLAIIAGGIVTVSAIRNLVEQAKSLIND